MGFWIVEAERLLFGGRFEKLCLGTRSSGGVIGDKGCSFVSLSKMALSEVLDAALETDEIVDFEIGIGRFGVTIVPTHMIG